MICSNDFIDYTIVSQSSEDTVHVASNLKLYKLTQRTYRTTAVTSQNFVLDMLAIKTAPLPIMIYFTNFTTIQIQANTTNSFGSPPFDTGNISITRDPEHRIRKLIVYITTNFQYIKVTIPGQTSTDGAAYFTIGSVIVPNSIKTFNLNKEQFEFPFNQDIQIFEQDILSEVGIIDSILLSRIPEVSFALAGKMGADFSTRDKLGSIFGRPGSGYILIDFELNNYEFYLVKRLATFSRGKEKTVNNMSYSFKTV